MAISRNAQGDALYPVGQNFVAEDTSFVSGDSPATHDVNNGLGYNAHRGYIKVDGAGDILVELSPNGTTYTTQFTLKNGDSFDLTGFDIDSIRITHSGTNSAYRIHAW